MNLIENLTDKALLARSLAWDHPPAEWGSGTGGGIRVVVPARVDYFQDPAGVLKKDDAPYLNLNQTGDFVAQAHIRPTFTTTWDAGAIMVKQDAKHWAKLCFESTDIGTTAAVSVVTNGVSDDANGADLTTADVWLQIARVGDVFGLHYALDGSHWRMVRLFKLSLPASVKVGLVAQCPAGPGTHIDFLSFTVEARTLKNLRSGL